MTHNYAKLAEELRGDCQYGCGDPSADPYQCSGCRAAASLTACAAERGRMEEALELIAIEPLGESEGCFKAVNEAHRKLARRALSGGAP